MDMKKILDETVAKLFENAGVPNEIWTDVMSGLGREVELYPFINREMFRSLLKNGIAPDDLYGIGYMKFKKPKKDIKGNGAKDKEDEWYVDFLLILKINGQIRRIGIEIKGPSKDGAYVERQATADLDRLKVLISDGDIDEVWACGIKLIENPKSQAYLAYLPPDSKKYGVQTFLLHT